jgi:fructuronate reductase
VSAAAAAAPAYDRSSVSAGVVHLGLGAFARAHLAVYLDDLLAAGHHGLGVVGVSLRNDDVPNALRPQDGLYTLGVVQGATVAPRIIGSVLTVLHAPSEANAVRAALATASVITVTVTEKGYCCDPASHRLDRTHADIGHDIDAPTTPRSLPGHIVLAASDRRARALPGVTVLSLDNLPANGRTLRSVVLDLAQATDPSLCEWIVEHLRFPCSMVDRIVPATTPGFRAEVASSIGLDDAWPVRAEPYSQWVLERAWVGERPPLQDVGVTIVDDVAPWEALKLRVVNGLHTTAAHFGLFHGLETVDLVMADPDGRRLLDRVAAEATEVLVAPSGVDIGEYVANTMTRFANPALAHRCAQIATDTSQKLPQRLLDTVRDRLPLGLPVEALTDVLALWAWSTLGLDHDGAPRAVHDPLATRYAEIAAQHGNDPAALSRALLSLDEIFGDLVGNAVLIHGVTEHLEQLLRDR